MPSVHTTLFGAGVALLLIWIGVGVCTSERVWGLVPTAAAVWMCVRFIERLRRAWSLQAGHF
ncbi:MAG: hypothetical protein JWR35_885 [Marmoricola sp.]|nr:hypothetical protein [Marmoricola sp.]